MNTEEWAADHGVCVDDAVPPVEDYDEPHQRTAEEVAVRTIVLHSVAAVGYGVDPGPVMSWLKEQHIWDSTSPGERNFLLAATPSDEACSDARWCQEAQWTLLWTIGRIESLGLPTRTCDTGKLVDEIMPALGDPINAAIASAELRPPSEVLAEEDRVYNLHCYARQAYHKSAMPDDLIYDVLFQRHYAFEWLSGECDWDDVRTDT